jgi:hypothetical protein
MKKLLAIGLVATVAVTGLVLSAKGQQVTLDGRVSSDPFIHQGQYSLYQNLAGTYYPGQPGSAETEKLARQLAKAKTDGEKETARAKLNDLLEKQFDERQKKHKAESEALEAQVKKLKDLISTRNENRKEIISRRLDQIVRDAQGLGW